MSKESIKPIVRLVKFLEHVIANPKDYKKPIYLNALKSQTGLAKLQVESFELIPCSLNTQKQQVKSELEIFPNGFADLNQLRKRALDAITEKSDPRSKKSLIHARDQLKNIVEAKDKEILKLQILVTRLRSEVSRLSSKSNDPNEKIHNLEFNREIEAILHFSNKD